MQNHVLTYANHFKHLYRQTFQPLSEQYEMSQLEIDILLFLKNNPRNNTAKEISVMRGFAKSNVSKAVESLRIQGYLPLIYLQKPHRSWAGPEEQSSWRL